MIYVGIIEDNNTLRQSFYNLINADEDLKCVVALNSLQNVVSECKKSHPDILLMDIGLPNISGIEGVRTVMENFDNIHVLMFTVFEDDENIFEAIKAGASGYLLKKTPPEEIIASIKSLYNGGAPMTASIARRVIQSFQNTNPYTKDTYKLTARESEILHSLVDGLSYKKLAEKYFISIGTIRSHISHIYEKLHVNSKAQAVAKVLKNELEK